MDAEYTFEASHDSSAASQYVIAYTQGSRLPGCSGSSRGNHWTAREDALLRELVRTHGACNWPFIASLVKDREAKQCRERCVSNSCRADRIPLDHVPA